MGFIGASVYFVIVYAFVLAINAFNLTNILILALHTYYYYYTIIIRCLCIHITMFVLAMFYCFSMYVMYVHVNVPL